MAVNWEIRPVGEDPPDYCHNKRYHGHKGNKGNASGSQHGNPSGAGQDNPMDTIDSQVLQEHFEMVDSLHRANQDEAPTSQTQTPEAPGSQVINAPQQTIHKMAQPTIKEKMRRQKGCRGGKGTTTKAAEAIAHMNQFAKETTNKSFAPNVVRPPVLKPQGKDKDAEEKNKEIDAAKRRKIWVSPGASTGGGGSHKRA